MPKIRPSSDLRNHFNEISDLCHKEQEPIFITRKGKEDLVVMSHAFYDMLMKRFELYQKLGEAETLDARGDEGISHKEMMNRLKKRIK